MASRTISTREWRDLTAQVERAREAARAQHARSRALLTNGFRVEAPELPRQNDGARNGTAKRG
jgi:hypothetical protein